MKNLQSPQASPEFILDRFCGREIYPITEATWNLYRDEELGMMNLCINIQAAQGTLLHEDTEDIGAEPWWEVNVVEHSLPANLLIPGAQFLVPSGYNEKRGGHVTNFYYCGHDGSDQNTVEILAAEGDQLLIRVTGKTVDVSYYDGSKPPTKLTVQTWFAHNEKTRRSVS